MKNTPQKLSTLSLRTISKQGAPVQYVPQQFAQRYVSQLKRVRYTPTNKQLSLKKSFISCNILKDVRSKKGKYDPFPLYLINIMANDNTRRNLRRRLDNIFFKRGTNALYIMSLRNSQLPGNHAQTHVGSIHWFVVRYNEHERGRYLFVVYGDPSNSTSVPAVLTNNETDPSRWNDEACTEFFSGLNLKGIYEIDLTDWMGRW